MRVDKMLLEKNMATSRTQAQKMIRAGQVQVKHASEWQVVVKVSELVDASSELRVDTGAEQRYVSRAGLKLAAALEHLQLDVTDLIALDIGQSTGGFSDCLVQAGVRHVVGVDVGHHQLAASLRGDARISTIEGLNARYLEASQLKAPTQQDAFDLVVMDVSFISQTLILPRLASLLRSDGLLISLVKPQFEVGPQGIGKGGVVKDQSLYQQVQHKVETAALASGLVMQEYFDSSILGGDGNREFFMTARLG